MQNLFIIILTQVVIRYFVIQPILRLKGFDLSISLMHFSGLALATILIAAAGYIINDYYDFKVDYINRPEKVLVGTKLSKISAFIFFMILMFTGLAVGSYISLKNDMAELIIIFLIISGLLWFYSYSYSKQFLIGNIVIAALTSMVPLIIGLSEIKGVYLQYKTLIFQHLNMIATLKYWIFGYTAFAFLCTLIREIIKDTEDFEGDFVDNRKTMPLILGIKTTKAVLSFMNIFMLISIIYIYIKYIGLEIFTFIYVLATLVFPIIYILYLIYKADNKKHYHLASNFLKYIMVCGILFSIVYKLNMIN
ncbi:MAG: geranylgeranylglycerol-phosphate geranylgeranyltransferase [Bacteroidales bacterium]|nr:geranylgeranylglycerol-phosphate geranylgeranyltransferase [Bacteroidales bacterium]